MERPRIEVVGLGKSFGAVDALTDITFKVGAGMVLGVLGHNGAGKTTLTDILATRSRPTTGTAKGIFGTTDQGGDDLTHLSSPKTIAANGLRAVFHDSGNQRLIKLEIVP